MHLSDDTEEKEDYSNVSGRVVALGDVAYCDRDTGEPWVGEWPKVGDRVLYRQTSGIITTVDGVDLRYMNDDNVKLILNDKVDVRAYLTKSRKF